MPAVIQAMRLSADPAIRACLKQYDAASEHDRKVVPFEAYAIAAGLDLRQLVGAMIFAMRERSVDEVKVIALSWHAKVTAATVKSALKERGYGTVR
jgi:hypothetical protein